VYCTVGGATDLRVCPHNMVAAIVKNLHQCKLCMAMAVFMHGRTGLPRQIIGAASVYIYVSRFFVPVTCDALG
jgi:hypothetical protein